MTRHDSNNNNNKKRTQASEPLTEQQKEELQLQELLQIYAPDKRESMRERILQRKQNKKEKK